MAKVFEILIASSASRREGGPLIPDNQLTYGLPDEAEEVMDPILEPYHHNSLWYFDRLNFGRPPAPWAIIALPRECEIAEHVRSARESRESIGFTQYSIMPNPTPEDFEPLVGSILIFDKQALGRAATSSILFEIAWTALRGCDEVRRWLCVLDDLPDEEIKALEQGKI